MWAELHSAQCLEVPASGGKLDEMAPGVSNPPRCAGRWGIAVKLQVVEAMPPGAGSAQPHLERLCQRRDYLEEILHNAIVCELEDGGLGVLVNGHDGLGSAHACQMLDGARDAACDVEVRLHRLACLPYLMGIGDPAGIHRGS